MDVPKNLIDVLEYWNKQPPGSMEKEMRHRFKLMLDFWIDATKEHSSLSELTNLPKGDSDCLITAT